MNFFGPGKFFSGGGTTFLKLLKLFSCKPRLGEKYVEGNIEELMRENEELMMHSEELMRKLRNTDNSGH